MRLLKWVLQIPSSDNVWDQFSNKLLHHIYIMVMLVLLPLIVTVLIRPNPNLVVSPAIPYFICTVISFILFQRGYIRLGGIALILSFCIILLASCFASTGVYAPSYTVLILFMMLTGICFEKRITLSLLFLAVGAGALMLPLHTSGFLITPEHHNALPFTMWIVNVALFSIVSMVMIITRETVIKTMSKLEHDQEMYRAIVEDQNEFIVRWKEGGIRTFANGAYLRYFNLTLEQAIGTNFFPQINEDDREWIREKIARLSVQNPVDTGEHRVIRPDGTTGWQVWSDRALFDDEGNIVEYQSVGRDTTAEKELEVRQRELDLAREREAFLRDFLSTMSHDLQTPLSVMRANLQLISRAPEKTEERIEKIDKQIDKLSGMIGDILTVARLEHLPELERHPNNFADLLESSVNPLRDEAKAKNIQLEIPKTLPNNIMKADATEFQRALSNIISNAIKYTPAGGNVKIDAYQRNDSLIIEVADTGIGIEAQDLPFIFERFYRAQNAKRFEKGTGLGLAIVKRIIELHDGTISASSKAGEGSRFTIILPLPQQTVPA